MTTVDSTIFRADQAIWTADGYVTPLSGSAAIALGGVALSASGAMFIAGQAGATLDGVTLDAGSALLVSGALAVVLQDLAASGTAGVVPVLDCDHIVELARMDRRVEADRQTRVIH